MRWFPDKASCLGEKLYTDIDLAPPIPDEDKTFGVSLEHDDVTCKPRIEVFDNRI